ncbi:MAG: potassium channel family protein [Phycisphaerae bacterium]|nr:potassium channel family protein [Phycisphaerae bacterium]
MTFQREKQNVTATDTLQALADGLEIKLSQCTITGSMDINRLFDESEKFDIQNLNIKEEQNCKKIIFAQPIVFDKCTFEENVVFSGPWSDPDSISAVFQNDVIFNSSAFHAQCRFRNAHFCKTAGFDGCSFRGVVTFKNAVIDGDAKFRTTSFEGYTLIPDALFNSSARFTNTHFVKGVNFKNTTFNSITDFSGVYSSSRSVPEFENIKFARKKFGDDESFWRFAKQSAQEAGYYHFAGECFYNERCAGLRTKSKGQNYDKLPLNAKIKKSITSIRLLPELIFGKILFGYGERPVRVLLASAVIIITCAFLYAQPNMLAYRTGPTENDFLQGLYFSMITFTTLGYGDLYPEPNSICRIIAMTQATAGGFLMALFVVCLAKRFSRG